MDRRSLLTNLAPSLISFAEDTPVGSSRHNLYEFLAGASAPAANAWPLADGVTATRELDHRAIAFV
jgi:hypothetical protein